MPGKKSDEFKLTSPPSERQERMDFPAAPRPEAGAPRVNGNGGRRRKDTVRLKWDSKPRRAPSPRDIEFQTAEVVIPNPARDAATLPFSFRDGVLDNENLDKTRMNRLVWGDNLLAMQALLASGYEGKIDLIYIDPPFATQADYSQRVYIGDSVLTKELSVIERLAYRDFFEAGIDSYLDALYPRLQTMKRLLKDGGSIYVHVGRTVSHYVKVMLDEIFDNSAFVNEITWKRSHAHGDTGQGATHFGPVTEAIFLYTKGENPVWNSQYIPYSEETLDRDYKYVDERSGERFRLVPVDGPGGGMKGNPYYEFLGVRGYWRYSRDRMQELYDAGEIVVSKTGRSLSRRLFLKDAKGTPVTDLWDDVNRVSPTSLERLGFATQKPESLLTRVIEASSNPNSLVADFFCGSGTTLGVAEKLGRRWIGCDFGKVGIQVTRSRLVEQDAKPFLIENIGNYQREMIYLHGGRIHEMQRVILKLYGATPHPQHADLGTRPINGNGSNGGDARERSDAKASSTADPKSEARATPPLELVYVGYPDRPTTAKKVLELQRLAATLDGTGYRRLVILAWDYDYNFNSDLEARQKASAAKAGGKPALSSRRKGSEEEPSTGPVQLALRTIPPDVYEYLKKARREEDVEALADKVQFHERPYLKLTDVTLGRKDADGMREAVIGIDRYIVFDFPVPDKDREKLREAVKENFAVLIDYWACDFSYDGATFRSEWQAIRGNGKRAKVVPTHTTVKLKAGQAHTIAVRLVDVFGNDAAAVIEVKA